jgi:integrase
MRYEEAKILKDNPDMFEREKIHLTPIAIKKEKIKIKERWITLTPLARKIVEDYLKVKKPLPHWNTWRENLVRWSKLAKMDSKCMSVKTTRKTWESWLATYYPTKLDIIYLNQGHTSVIALKHYLNLPFTQKDKSEMFEFVAGWEP